MSLNTSFPEPGWLIYRDESATKKMAEKPIQWFAEQADESFDEQAQLSADISALIGLATKEIGSDHEDEGIAAIMRAIQQLTAKWDSAMCKLCTHHEELINRLHAAEATAGETA